MSEITQDRLRESTAEGIHFIVMIVWMFFIMSVFVYSLSDIISYYGYLINTYPYPLVIVGVIVVEGAVFLIPYVVFKHLIRFVVFNLSILEPPTSSKYESLEDVKESYARGELDDEQMERRVGRALEREGFGDE